MPSSISSSENIAARRRQYDERLISMAQGPRDWIFIASIGAAALFFFVLWSLAIPYLPKYLPTLNQSEGNRQVIVDFERDDISSITLAGTSLLYRLSSRLFDVKTANVSLPGQSPVSSAMIASERNPRILVIEINILDRPRNLELEGFARRIFSPPLGLQALNFAYSPVRSVVSRAFDLDVIVDQQARATADAARQLIDRTPEPLNSGEAVSSAARALNKRPVDGTISQSAQDLRAIADRIETSGGKAFYLLMPMHPLVAATEYETRSKDAMIAADPKFSDRLLKIDWNDEIRWEPDGAHLDARSAAIVARQLEQVIAKQTR